MLPAKTLPVMITYLHHTSPKVPKYSASSWTFVRGATATIDRDFGIIGTHFFHNISSDHVTHHLFSKIPHYYAPIATAAIVPLLGQQYHERGGFGYGDLKEAFSKCQWVEEDEAKDKKFGLDTYGEGKVEEANRALWYRAGVSPTPEFRMRQEPSIDAEEKVLASEAVKI
jgi:bifunctional Delta-12/omega-3 fatty acid desaturase